MLNVARRSSVTALALALPFSLLSCSGENPLPSRSQEPAASFPAPPPTPTQATSDQPQPRSEVPSPQVAEEKVDPDLITLALRFVEYEEGGVPVLNQAGAIKITQEMNAIYSACKIRFKLEDYAPVIPENYGLNFHTSSMGELDRIRAQFDQPNRLVIVNTGSWNHATMGSANAWTAMPGEHAAGAIIEAPVASFSAIVAHELGHYLSLDHATDSTNLMNPIIYPDSIRLSTFQCEQMRETARGFWAGSLR